MRNKITWYQSSSVLLKAVLLNLGVQVLFSLAYSAVVLFTNPTGASDAIATVPNLIAAMLIQTAFFIAIATTVIKDKVAIPYLGEQKISVVKLILAVLTAVVLVACFFLVAEWFAVFLNAIGYKTSALNVNTPLEWVLAVIAVVIFAPVMEETLFRSVLLGGLTARKGAVFSVLLSGLSFALMHMSAEQTVYQFILGCTCALITLSSGCYVYAIVIHAASNLIALVLPLLPVIGSKSGNVSVVLDNPALSVPITVALALAGAGLIALLAKAFSKNAVKVRTPAEEKSEVKGFFSSNALFIMAIAICAFMWLCNAVVALI